MPRLNWASTAGQEQAEELGWRKLGGDREVGSPRRGGRRNCNGVGVRNVSWGPGWLWGPLSASEWERVEPIP